MIQEAASQFSKRIPALICLPEPKFSNGWIAGFKRRYNIKRYRQHGEAGSAKNIDSEERMVELRKLVDEYGTEDTYNLDESGLF